MKFFAVRILPLILVAVGLTASQDWLFANAYSFSGITLSNFSVFTEDSIANSADLTKGPNRDGTGNQLDTSDFLPRLSGSGGGPAQLVELDGARISSGGLYSQRCLGACGFSEDDFSAPPAAPTDPTGIGPFARSDLRQSGNVFSTSTRRFQLSTVAETEIAHQPTRGSAVNRARYERGVYFVPAFTDELVIDFDASVVQRTLSDVAAHGTYITSSSKFVISLSAPIGATPFFSFSPDGMPGGNFGAVEISDPTSMNANRISLPIAGGENNQHFGSGQFRVITPILNRDVAYELKITQIVEIRAAAVPEPTSLLMIVGSAGALIGYRKKL